MQIASVGRQEYNRSHILHRLLLLLLLLLLLFLFFFPVRVHSSIGCATNPTDPSPPMHQPNLVTPPSLVLGLDSPPIRPLMVALPKLPIPSTPMASSHFSTWTRYSLHPTLTPPSLASPARLLEFTGPACLTSAGPSSSANAALLSTDRLG